MGLKMEYLEKVIKKRGWETLISSIIFAILGIILIVNPEGTIKVVSYILGAMFILTGLFKIINYFLAKGKNDLFNYDIAFGAIAIILGIVTIVYSMQIGSIIRILIGLWIIYSSILRLNLAFKLKTLESNIWISSLIIAVIMMICGLYIIFISNAILISIGIVILIYAISDIIESILFLMNTSKLI